MAANGLRIHHVDLAVSDVERSLAFYLALLGPLGLREWERFPSYRGTEEIVYLCLGDRENPLYVCRPIPNTDHVFKWRVGLSPSCVGCVYFASHSLILAWSSEF